MTPGDLPVRPGLTLPAREIEERFSASGGPGGQHAGSPTLSEYQRHRLVERFGPELRVVVDEERSQLRNRSIARDRLGARLANALTPTRTRRPTRPTKGSQTRRLQAKRQRGETKQARRRPGTDD